MTILELKEAIKDLPDNMDVFIEKSNGDFSYALVEMAKPKTILFLDADLKGSDYCFVLTDEI